jgi:hypothetical protein
VTWWAIYGIQFHGIDHEALWTPYYDTSKSVRHVFVIGIYTTTLSMIGKVFLKRKEEWNAYDWGISSPQRYCLSYEVKSFQWTYMGQLDCPLLFFSYEACPTLKFSNFEMIDWYVNFTMIGWTIAIILTWLGRKLNHKVKMDLNHSNSWFDTKY